MTARVIPPALSSHLSPLTSHLSPTAYHLRQRLLPREAVNGPQSPYEVSGVDPDDRPVAEELTEDAERRAIARVVERGNQDGRVGDVEIRVGRREAAPVEDDRRRHRQLDHLDARPVLETHSLEPLAVFLQGDVVRVGGIVLAAENHGRGVGEPAEVVDVAVRVVAGDTPSEPEHVA